MIAPNKSRQHAAQSGQAIVLLALAMVGILAFVVLALDGGRYFTQRRAAQNAADMAALAGVYLYGITTDPSTLSDQQVLTKINQVAEINQIPDTNGLAGDVINANVTAWWANGNGTLLRQITTNATQYVPAGASAIKVFAQIPYPTFIGGLINRPNLVAQSEAIAGVTYTSTTFTDNQNSIWTGGSDCDNLTDRIGYNYSNTNTAKFTSSVYIDGSLAVGSVNSTEFDGNVTVRVMVGSSNKADGPYTQVDPVAKNPFQAGGNKFVDPAHPIWPTSPNAAARGFSDWAYIKVNEVEQQIDANSFKPGTGIVYQEYVKAYTKGMLPRFGNIPPDTFFNTIPVGATAAQTLANVNAAYAAGKRGIYWIDGDLIVTGGIPWWQDVSLITTGRFQSQDSNHEFYDAGPLAWNISVLAGKDYGGAARCASDYNNWVFSVTGNNNQFFGVIYIPYGQMFVSGNTSGGTQFSRGIVTYSVYLGNSVSSANSWQFSFDPTVFTRAFPSTALLD